MEHNTREISAVPILFIHGSICDSSFYSESEAILAEHYTTVLYDRRGYGRCPKPQDGDYSMASQGEDAAALIRERGYKQVYVVAHSAGTLVAMELARSHPELVAGMILAEPPVAFSESTAEKLSEWSSEIAEFTVQKKYARAFMAFVKTCGDDRSAASGKGSLQDVRDAYANLLNFLKGESGEIPQYSPDTEALRSLTCPVDVLVSEDGQELMFGLTSHELAENMHWPIRTMPGYHSSPREHPEAFAEIVDGILREKMPSTVHS